MPTSKECPLCGGAMRFRETRSTERLPGQSTATTHVLREWVCPDCDYFEEVDEDER